MIFSRTIITSTGILLLTVSTIYHAPAAQTLRRSVVDESGNPICGAEVRLVGAARSTTSASNGSWSITVPLSDCYVLPEQCENCLQRCSGDNGHAVSRESHPHNRLPPECGRSSPSPAGCAGISMQRMRSQQYGKPSAFAFFFSICSPLP